MNINKTNYPDIWYGILHIKTTKKNDEMLGDVTGAYVNLIAKAHGRKEFVALIKDYARDHEFDFVELSEVSTLQDRVICGRNIADNLLETASSLEEYGHVRFGTFHTY